MGWSISVRGRQEIRLLAAVGCLALGLQVWLLWRSPVPSLDAVRFVRSAALIDQVGLSEAIGQRPEAPLWIIWLWAVHRGVVLIWGETPWAWAASVQLAACLPLLVAFILTARLACRLWGNRLGIWAALLFCTLPEAARLGVDGLSDSLHLALAVGALLALVEAIVRWGSGLALLWVAGGGVLVGLASLVRAEVLAVPAAWMGTWVLLWFQQKRRTPLRELLLPIGVFLIGFGGVLGGYAKAVRSAGLGELVSFWSGVGGIGPTKNFLLPPLPSEQNPPDHKNPPQLSQKAQGRSPETEDSLGWRLPDGSLPSFAAKEPSPSIRRRGWGPMVLRSLHKMADVWGYWVGGLALVGLWNAWRKRQRQPRPIPPETIFLGLTAAGVFAGAALYGVWVGYLEARHLVLMVVCGIGAAGVGADQVGRWLAKRFSPRQVSSRSLRQPPSDPANRVTVQPSEEHLPLPSVGEAGQASAWPGEGDNKACLFPSFPLTLTLLAQWGEGKIALQHSAEMLPHRNPSVDPANRNPSSDPTNRGVLKGQNLGSEWGGRASAETGRKARWRLAPLGAAVLASLLVQIGGVHGTRLGHRLAGDYLALHADPQAAVVDTRGWTGLYSGRATYLYGESAGVWADPRLGYVVVESEELASESVRAKTLRFLLDTCGERMGVFPSWQEKNSGITRVELYRWDGAGWQRRVAQLGDPLGGSGKSHNISGRQQARCAVRPQGDLLSR